MNVHSLPATQLAALIKSKKISSAELLEVYIDRFKRFNASINAIVAVDFEAARAFAKKADEALARGEDWGPLHGLPMTIKDTIEVAGMPCTSGSVKLKTHVPQKDADVVDLVRGAGAIIFGKTNTPMFGQDFQTFNDVYGQTNNPWNAARVPGGSSGGAAAALAAGLTPLEIGSDIGGSIRSPAHFCGVFGHKPSYNIVPFRGHIPPFPGLFPGDYSIAGDIAVIGPLARSAADLELLMNIIVKPQIPMQRAWKLELPPPRKNALSEFKIGIWLDDADFPVDAMVGDCLSDLVDLMAKQGANISDRRPDINFKDSHDIYTRLLAAVPNAALPKAVFDQMLADLSNLSDEDKSFRAQLIRGTTLRHRDWVVLDYLRLLMRQKWADYFRQIDVLLCPAVPVTAFAHDHGDFFARALTVNNKKRSYADTLSAWAGLTGVSYLPATVAPAGIARDGLPVGVQIVGPYLEDKTPLRFAGLIEEMTGGFRVPPGFE
jgi:amidase